MKFILGAARAFGLSSLLPLNVPANKPLMYCNGLEIAQARIRINETTYSCNNSTIIISCPKVFDNETFDECSSETMICGTLRADSAVYCASDTLLNRSPIFCNSTIVVSEEESDEPVTVLDCYEGELPSELAAYVPTTTTEEPITIAENEHSFGSNLKSFFMKLFGASNTISEPANTSESIFETTMLTQGGNETRWIPEALTMPPETKTLKTSNKTSEKGFYIYLSNGQRLWIWDYSDNLLEKQKQMQESLHNFDYD